MVYRCQRLTLVEDRSGNKDGGMVNAGTRAGAGSSCGSCVCVPLVTAWHGGRSETALLSAETSFAGADESGGLAPNSSALLTSALLRPLLVPKNVRFLPPSRLISSAGSLGRTVRCCLGCSGGGKAEVAPESSAGA